MNWNKRIHAWYGQESNLLYRLSLHKSLGAKEKSLSVYSNVEMQSFKASLNMILKLCKAVHLQERPK